MLQASALLALPIIILFRIFSSIFGLVCSSNCLLMFLMAIEFGSDCLYACAISSLFFCPFKCLYLVCIISAEKRPRNLFEMLIPTMDVVKLKGDIQTSRKAHEFSSHFLVRTTGTIWLFCQTMHKTSSAFWFRQSHLFVCPFFADFLVLWSDPSLLFDL